MPIAAKRLLPKAILLVAAALLVTGLSACDSQPDPAPPVAPDARQVTVVGSGQVQGTPDTLIVDVSIVATARDVTAAMNQTSTRTQAVIDALVAAKVDRKDISTSSVNLEEQTAPDSPAVIGYRASNSLAVKLRDLAAASRNLALIVSTGGNATRISSVNFLIDDESALVRDARSRAFEDAKARAEQYAQLSGLTLGKVISISESSDNNAPLPRQAPATTFEAVPLEPGQQAVGFAVTVIWELT